MSLVFSNVPGPKTPWVINGSKANRLMFFVPGLANLGAGISIISHADVFKFGCIGDLSEIPNPKEIIELFEKNTDKLLKGEFDYIISGNKKDN